MSMQQVNFEQLNERSLGAVWFLGQTVEAFIAQTTAKGFKWAEPCEIWCLADNPAKPLAIFEFSRIKDTLTHVGFDEEEMFREGRGEQLKIKVMPSNGGAE